VRSREPVRVRGTVALMVEDVQDPQFEYAQCTDFYNSRDTLTGELFVRFVQTFSTLIVVLGALTFLGDRVSTWLQILATSVVGLVGFIAFLAILLDLAGTASVKEEVRRYAHDLEGTAPTLPQLWSKIGMRRMFAEEKWLKAATPSRLRERELEGGLYLVSARVALILWPVVVIGALLDI
jgi:hypothetical protein